MPGSADCSPRSAWNLRTGRAPPPAVSYYHADHLGSPLLRFDADGKLVGQRRYGVYGEIVEDDGFASVSEGFTGAAYERGFDLSVFEARAMAGASGRFLSPDPVLLHVASPPLSPQALNPFSYAANRPLTHIDPDGRAFSAIVTAALIVYDNIQYKTGNLSGGQYAAAMILNGAALVADMATLGMGGGMAVRAGNLAVRMARRVSHADNVYSTANLALHAGRELWKGNYGEALPAVGLGIVGGARSGIWHEKGPGRLGLTSGEYLVVIHDILSWK